MKEIVNTSFHRRELEKHLQRILPTLNGRILEAGSKNRRYDHLLSSRPVAIDLIENKALEIAYGDITSMQFPSDSFDSVISIEVLEYVLSFPQALNEVYRVLRKGGVFVFSIPFMYRTHDDSVRYTHKGLEEFLKAFEKCEIVAVGNYYTILLDIIRDKIRSIHMRIPKYSLYCAYYLLVILLPIMRRYSDEKHVSGYVVKAVK
jgi:SAM-dependent methyltransferase